MKPRIAVIIFSLLMISSVALSLKNYVTTKECIINDMNQALAKTLQQESIERISADTLKVFRENLQITQLKDTAYLSLCTDEPSRVSICSDTMSIYNTGDIKVQHIRAYTNFSRAALFGMSEQTWPSILLTLSILWGMFSLVWLNRKNSPKSSTNSDSGIIKLGTLSFSPASNSFYNERNEAVYFTPMQLQLMTMFFTSSGHRLSVADICSRLWPGKDDARETLYTLIRRLKQIIEQHSNIRIIAEKGSYYSLQIENKREDK